MVVPTAMHAVLEAQLTPPRVAVDPSGLGIDSSDHSAPSQLSANASGPERVLRNPIAVHAVVKLHETPDISEPVEPAGRGVGCTDQALPFQLSASGLSVPLVAVHPTAIQLPADVHDTPL